MQAKSSVETSPLIGPTYALLNTCGLNPLKQNIRNTLISYSIIIAVIILEVELLLGFILKWNGLNSMFDVTLFCALYQVLLKMFALIINRQKLLGIFFTVETFWQFKGDVEMPEDVKRTYSLIKVILTIAVPFFAFVAVVFCIAPYLFRTLIFRTYHPLDMQQSPDYEIIYFLQCYGSLGGVIAYYGFDLLFLFFIFCIVCESTMIKERIRLITDIFEQTHDEGIFRTGLRIVVDQHNLVLRCIQDLNDCYYIMVLNHCLTSMFCLSTILVTIMVKGQSDIFNYIRTILYDMAFLGLFFLYCFCGTALASACESILDGVIDSNWWGLDNASLKKSLSLIIQRSQKEEKITIGGMFDLNLKTFTSVCQSVYSITTLLQAVYRK